MADLGGELGGEGADAGVGVDDDAGLDLEDALDDEAEEPLGLAGVDLEEGGGGDPVVPLPEALMVGALAAGGARGGGAGAPLEVGLDQVVVVLLGDADGDLAGLHRAVLDLREEFVRPGSRRSRIARCGGSGGCRAA